LYYSKHAFRGVHAVLIVFDVTDKQSLERVRFYKSEMEKNITDQSVLDASVLVGNKVDLESERVVSTEDARKLAEELRLTYIETSAKSGSGVNAAFCTPVSIAVQGGIPKYSPAPETPIKEGKTSRCILS
jgi:GTPase SAR1 family protein